MTYPETWCQNVYISKVWKIHFESEETDNSCPSVDQMSPSAVLHSYTLHMEQNNYKERFGMIGSKHMYIHGTKKSLGN